VSNAGKPSMGKRRMVGGAEQDAFSGWRRFIRFRPGERALIKRKANRRERRSARQALEVPND
jgi:hypothetical protein